MTRKEIITALRHMLSGARFPREACGVCPLQPAKGDGRQCVDCIDNVLRNAAWMLEKDGDTQCPP